MKTGTIYILTGMSGGGKTTITKELRRRHPNLFSPISVTNRPPRPGEIDGVNYEFVSSETFKNLINNNELFVWSEAYGNFYGLRRHAIDQQISRGRDVFFETVVESAKKLWGSAPNIKIVFVSVANPDEQSERLRARGTEGQDMEQRIMIGAAELAWAKQNSVPVVITGDVARSVEVVERLFGLNSD